MSFQFKQFFIDDTNTPMKVGIDGVLLGSWVELRNNSSILDVGAGNGLVSLMLSQRSPDAEIVAVEINADAFNDCLNNFKSSPWNSRMEAINADFVSYNWQQKFDVIVSNPPFFESDKKNIKQGRAMARINDYLPLNVFFEKSNSILSQQGEIVIIYPYEKRDEAITNALLNGMYLKKELRIRDTEKSNFKRSILHFSQSKEIERIDIEILSLKDENGDYSFEFKVLTNEFYL